MQKSRVLIADSNPFVRKAVRQFLSREDMELFDVDSGALVIQRVRDVKPDLIILDDRMSGPGGQNMLKAIKGEDGMRAIPVIVLKEKTPEFPDSSDSLGIISPESAFDVLFKPVDVNMIRKTARKALRITSSDSETLWGEDSDGISRIDFGEFPDRDFIRFQEYLMAKVGLFFDIKRKPDLARALNRRMKSLGLSRYSEYFDNLNHSSYEEKELKNLILHLTIGETTFFRSPDQFLALRGYILPRIIEARRTYGTPYLRIWSAGCSTGEEPYSIAIALKESMPDFDRWDIKIFATDINNKFVKFAERGVYPARKVRFVKDDILEKYFRFDGEGYAVDPALRKYINFDYNNLSSDNYRQFQGMDIIFCRNVLIYFKRDRIREVIDRFRDVLVENGYLMLGYSETLFQISDDFASIHYGDAFFYRRLSIKEKDEIRQRDGLPEGFVRNFINKRLSLFSSRPAEQAELNKELLPKGKREFTPPPTYTKPAPEPPNSSIHTQPAHEGQPDPMAAEFLLPQVQSSELDLWEEGMENYFQEKFEKAEKIFKSIRESHPNSARAKLGEAFILANHGNDRHALDMLERALSVDDLLPEAYYLRGLLHEKDGEIDAAVKDYQNVILLDPDFVMAHFNLAILYMKKSLMRDSRREFANTLNILKRYQRHHNVKFSGGLHREALMQLCQDFEV